MITITVNGEYLETATHVPMPAKRMGDAGTLCGWCDVDFEEHEHTEKPVNCKVCIAKIQAIKKMRFPKGYFADSD